MTTTPTESAALEKLMRLVRRLHDEGRLLSCDECRPTQKRFEDHPDHLLTAVEHAAKVLYEQGRVDAIKEDWHVLVGRCDLDPVCWRCRRLVIAEARLRCAAEGGG